MYSSTLFARTVLALAVIFCIASTVGFAVTPPAGPWWWTGAFVNGQAGLVTIWAALGSAPRYVRWPCWYAALELTGRHLQRTWGAWELQPHAILSFVVLSLLGEFGMHIERDDTPSGDANSLRQFTLRTLFVWVASAALASWVWRYRLELFPGARWLRAKETLSLLGMAATWTALDLITIQAALRAAAIRWRLILLVGIVALVQTGLWRFQQSWLPLAWWHDLSRLCVYDLFYIAPVGGVLLSYRWAKAAVRG
ncbi:MAG TPA: hypothetical protein VG826_01030 [Pirellulales bacterium]|nr:hypothetical protein [Pirellulales bacterium]